eukprot:9469488-Pyramimonas_sp.AAC.1
MHQQGGDTGVGLLEQARDFHVDVALCLRGDDGFPVGAAAGIDEDWPHLYTGEEGRARCWCGEDVAPLVCARTAHLLLFAAD